ncbi:MAG: hypothetical protein U0Q16_13485 [Bryobacteraceae bacterium]
MIRIATILAIASSLLASSLFAQLELGGLRTGYVADDTTRVVRPVLGIPGAAYLGAALNLDFPVASVSLISGGSALVAISGGDQPEAWLVRDLDSASPAARSLGSATDAFASIRASVVVLYSRSQTSLRIVSQLDREPNAGPAVSEDTLGGKFRFASVDEDSGCAAVVSTAEGETRIHEFCPSRPAEARFLRSLPGLDPAAIVYSKALGGLLLADRSGRVTLLRTPLDSGAMDPIAFGLDMPAGAQALSSTRALIASAASPRAWIVDAKAKAVVQTIDLPIVPAALYYLVPGRVLACNRPGDDPLLVIDLQQDAAPYFVAGARAGGSQ